MAPLSLPVFGMSFICYYVAIFYLWIYLRRKKEKIYIAFSLESLSAAFYITFCFMLYNSKDLPESMFWQNLQFISISFFGIGFVWFCHYFIGGVGSKRPYQFLTLSFLVSFLIYSFVHNDLTLSLSNPLIREIRLGHGIGILYREVRPGLLVNIQIFFEFLVFLYMLFLLIKHLWGKGAGSMIFAFSVFLVALINDIFVANDIYRFIYTAEYAFMFIVLSNANLMIGRFIDLQNEMEDINKKLEIRIAERTKELEAANVALKEASLCDSLTGLRNRRYIQEYVVDYVNKFLTSKLLTTQNLTDQRTSSTNDTVMGIMMLDIDHFKRINDKYGHAAGDHALKQLSARMKDSFRSDDIVIRWGGEEFLVILNKIDPKYTPYLAKKMLHIFRDTKIRLDEKTEGVLTCSIGITTFPISDDFPSLLSFNDCINCCDLALYLSKQGGRNRATYVEVDETLLAEQGSRYSAPSFHLDVSGLDDPLFIKTAIE